MKSTYHVLTAMLMAFAMIVSISVVAIATSESELLESDIPSQKFGLLTDAQLETACLDIDDIPEALISRNIDTSELVHRVRSAEDEFSLVYQKRDGTCQKFVFSETVQYKNKNGKLNDKKNKNHKDRR